MWSHHCWRAGLAFLPLLLLLILLLLLLVVVIVIIVFFLLFLVRLPSSENLRSLLFNEPQYLRNQYVSGSCALRCS
jgi:hypothetical protein